MNHVDTPPIVRALTDAELRPAQADAAAARPWANPPARQAGPECPAGGLGQRDACSPVPVALFGSAARGELRENGDLLVVLADGDPADPNWTRVNICEAIGYRPRADVVVALEENLRKAARSLTGIDPS